MAKTTIQGTGGDATLPTGNAKLTSWSADLTVKDVETTGFGDAGYATYEPVLVSMTGSAAGTGITETAVVGTSVLGTSAATVTSFKGAMTLTVASGKTWSGTAIITNVKMNRSEGEKFDVSYDFKFSGAITEAWA